MKLFSLFICVILSNNIFSQEVSIPTKFLEEGSMYEKFNDFSHPLTEFKENEKCIVISYLGKDTYKIKYKEWVGFVKSDFLLINEEMMDLYFANEEKERIKAIEEKENRRKKIQEIIRKRKEESDRERRKDSIVKAKETEKRQLEEQEIAMKQDSIAKIELTKKRQLEEEEASRKREAERVRRIRDSIAKIEAAKKRQLEEQEVLRKREAKRVRRIRDSIARFEATKKRQLEEEVLRKREAERVRRIRDSIAKVEAAKKRQLEKQEISRKKEAERVKKEQESVVKIKEVEKKPIVEQEAVENIEVVRKKTKFQSTCHYLINEFDKLYKEALICTEPYTVNKNLTIQLYKQGKSANVFFDLLEDLGCASSSSTNRSYVKVQLENNQIITFYHSWNSDCGNFRFKGKLSSSQMMRLKKSPIKSIKLKGTENSREITSIDYKYFFIDKLRCIE